MSLMVGWLSIAGAIVWAAQIGAAATQCAGFLAAATLRSPVNVAFGEEDYTGRRQVTRQTERAMADLTAVGCKLRIERD
jgi:hypothetical protein